jgi:hypothetical protein
MIPLTTSASCSTMLDAGDVGKIVERKDDGMAKKTKKPNQKMQAWIEARKRHHLSHAQVHMARELGMNPAKLGKIDNHKQQPVEAALAAVYRRAQLQAVRQDFPRSSSVYRGAMPPRSSEERRKAHCPVAYRGQPDNAGSSITLTESDGNKSRANPIGAIGDVSPRHTTFGGSRPRWSRVPERVRACRERPSKIEELAIFVSENGECAGYRNGGPLPLVIRLKE